MNQIWKLFNPNMGKTQKTTNILLKTQKLAFFRAKCVKPKFDLRCQWQCARTPCVLLTCSLYTRLRVSLCTHHTAHWRGSGQCQLRQACRPGRVPACGSPLAAHRDLSIASSHVHPPAPSRSSGCSPLLNRFNYLISYFTVRDLRPGNAY